MDENSKSIDILIKYFLNAIDKKIGKLKCDREATVIDSNGIYCKVSINGSNYNIKNGTNISFIPGDKCLVHLINGNQQRKIIIAKL